LILLAEDNETNRDVLSEQLRCLGYRSEAAEDGVQALQMWQCGHYALLLTDCHMPRMDGFSLTEAIRQAEAPGQHAIIIAVSANAMAGEAQRCLAHGMDGFLPKPLRMAELQATLARWLPLPDPLDSAPAQPQDHDAPAPCQNAEPAVWLSDTLALSIGNNPGLQHRLLTKFLHNAHRQLAQMQAAVQAQTIQQIAVVAHTLKSAARTVGAMALGELCQQIESSVRAGHVQACLTQVHGLTEALERVEKLIGESMPIPAEVSGEP
jgi:CheY-like chemotaxis protein/HPt (histidine-containing phosphotransfer) domain-containing protein